MFLFSTPNVYLISKYSPQFCFRGKNLLSVSSPWSQVTKHYCYCRATPTIGIPVDSLLMD